MPTSADPLRLDSRQAWIVAWASFLVLALGGGAHYIIIVGLKPIATEFDWPRQVPALCYSLVMFGMGLGGIVMGRWSDRVGVSPPLVIGAFSIATGAWLAGSAEDKWTLFLAHGVFIGFFGVGGFFPPLLANVTKWFDRRRGVAVALVSSGQTVGGALWPPIFRYVIDHHGWRETYFLFGVVVVACALPWVWFLRGSAPEMPRGPWRELPSGPREGSVLGLAPGTLIALLSVAIVGCCGAMAMPIVHLVAHATDLGISGVEAAQMLSVLLGSAAISRMIWGWVADRIGGLRTMLASSFCQALFLGCFAFVEARWAMYLVSALFGLGFGGIVPCYTLIIREYFSTQGIGWRVGTVLLFGTVGMALGGWLGALVYDLNGSYSVSFLVGVGFNLVNLLIGSFLVLRQARLGAPLRWVT